KQNRIVLIKPNIGSTGTRDSDAVLWEGKANDGTERATWWRQFVDVVTNAGNSIFKLQRNLNGAGWSDAWAVLGADTTYYVATSGNGGSNSNDGLSSSAPFLTVQKAFDTIATVNNGGFAITISVGAGTFAGGTLTGPLVGTGAVTLIGAGA